MKIVFVLIFKRDRLDCALTLELPRGKQMHHTERPCLSGPVTSCLEGSASSLLNENLVHLSLALYRQNSFLMVLLFMD